MIKRNGFVISLLFLAGIGYPAWSQEQDNEITGGHVIKANTTLIANPGYAAETASRPPVERAWIYRPEAAWSYSHHPSLTFFNGQYYAIWSNGRRNEDAPGQRVLLSTSADFRNWTTATPLVNSQPAPTGSEYVFTASGFHQHAGRLVAYVGRYSYLPEGLEPNGERKPADAHHTGTTLLALSTTDGEHWSEPTDLGLPTMFNTPPTRLKSGRLLAANSFIYPYTDDPAGLTGWKLGGLIPPSMRDKPVDDSETIWRLKEEFNLPVPTLCEGSFFQTDDGVIHMQLRTNSELLWQTKSADDGATWSPPQATGFSDNATKFHYGRLPDGRFYYVGCPDPEPLWQRTPLVLSLSEDGIHFDHHFILADDSTPYKQQAPGMHKGGEYGYPNTLVHEGFLHVIVSRRKEAVEVLRVRLQDVARASILEKGIKEK